MAIHYNRNVNRNLIHHFANGSSFVHSSASLPYCIILWTFFSVLVQQGNYYGPLWRDLTEWRAYSTSHFSYQYVVLLVELVPPLNPKLFLWHSRFYLILEINSMFLSMCPGVANQYSLWHESLWRQHREIRQIGKGRLFTYTDLQPGWQRMTID